MSKQTEHKQTSRFYDNTIGFAQKYLYNEEIFELEQCCNFLPEIQNNLQNVREHALLPVKQVVRALMAVYLLNILWSGYKLLPVAFYMTLESTFVCQLSMFCLILTYASHLSTSKSKLNMWAWTHFGSSIMLFVHAWHVSLYWNFLQYHFEAQLNSLLGPVEKFDPSKYGEEELLAMTQERQDDLKMAYNIRQSQLQFNMRAVNAPAIFMTVNFLITDWLLLSKHSLFMVSSIAFAALCKTMLLAETQQEFLALYATKQGWQKIIEFCLLLAGVHFAQWILVSTQNTFNGRKIFYKPSELVNAPFMNAWSELRDDQTTGSQQQSKRSSNAPSKLRHPSRAELRKKNQKNSKKNK